MPAVLYLNEADARRLGLPGGPAKRPKRLQPDWRPGFLVQLAALGVFNKFGEPEIEYHFHPTRAWRLDVAWPAMKLAVEIEGGTWIRGRHTRGRGFEDDARKYAEAMLLGWRILRVTPAMMFRADAAIYTAEVLARIRTGQWLPAHPALAGPYATRERAAHRPVTRRRRRTH